MKKLTPQFRAIIIIALIITASLPAFAYEENDIYYTIINKKKKTVKVTGCAEKKREIVIPNSIKINGISYSVTEIDDRAFDYCDGLTSVTIPNSVTTIGEHAFWDCDGLTSVTIGNSVTTIGDEAFWSCDKLDSIVIPSSVTKIGHATFMYCNNLKSVIIPNSVTSIGSYAFSHCDGLTSVTIPNSVTSIGPDAFSHCDGLTSVTIPNSVTTIGNDAFLGCTVLTSVTIPNSVTTIGDWAFEGCSNLTTVYFNADNCITMGSSSYPALSDSPIRNIIIGKNVKIIPPYAFLECRSITNITIPDSVTQIGKDAFEDCTSLSRVDITDLSAWSKIDFEDFKSNPLYYAKSLYLNNELVTSLDFPNDFSELKNFAFVNCKSLTEINITDLSAWCKIDFEYTSSNPLYYAKKLKFNGVEIKDLVIPNDITEIKNSAFSGCSGLTSVTIPNSVTKIGNSAFRECSGLTSVTIPNSVTEIGYEAFKGCSSLTSVTIGNSVTTIGNSAFSGCSGLTSVVIPNSVTVIRNFTFEGCSGLTSITIPNSVTEIGYEAFKGCSGLTKVIIPNSVKEIGSSAFEDCNNLDSVIITNPDTEYEYSFYLSPINTFPKHTKIIRPKQEEKSERDSYRWQYVSYGDDKCGAKSTDGKEIVPTEYSEVEYVPNYEGYFLVRKNGCYAIYNPSGKIIIPISRGYSSIIKTRSDGRIYYRVSKGGKYGVCGIDGYEILAPLYDNIICIDGVFLYKDINGTWIPLNKGLDKNNAVVENPTYTKRDVAYYDLALQQGRLEDSFGKKVRVEQTSTEGTRAFKIVFEDKILFEFGEYDLSSSALDYIDKVAETLKELPSTRVRITGYTDNVGSLASNRRLSTQRANAVSEYLQQKGISASRIIAKGVPLADYVATNKTEEGRALNRRVEIIIEAK